VFISRYNIAMPLAVHSNTYIMEDDFRRLSTAVKDFVLYSAVVVNSADSDKLQGLTPYNLADTANAGNAQSFAQAAALRRSLGSSELKTTVSGMEGSITINEPGILLVQIPYDTRFSILLNGQETEYFLANFGMIGVQVKAGSFEIKVEIQN
jgi:uncharacterized membrane protein YfhO